MRLGSPWILVIFFGITALLAFGVSSVIGNLGFGESELQAFYVQGFSRTALYVASFFAFCACLSLVYASIPPLRHTLANTLGRVSNYFDSASLLQYGLLSFTVSAVVLFALNAPGILSGTFLIDDYEMYGIATQSSVWQLLWTPINEHVIPLFWLELKALFTLAGTNAPILNLPLYGAATIAIGSAGVLLRQLRLGIGALSIFLTIFSSTTIVSHQLYGFYAVAPYFQVLAVFTLSLVCFVRSKQEKRFSMFYSILSIVLIVVTILIESGGIWAPLAFALFSVAYSLSEKGDTSIASIWQAVLKEKVTVVLCVSIIALYFVYLLTIPYFSDATFYGPDRLPISIVTLYELYKVFTAGVLSAFFMPRFGLIMSQPSFESIEAIWHIAMFALFSGTALTAWWAYARGGMRTRIWGIYFLLLATGTSLLVAIARPSSHSVSFYRDQNVLFPLFFVSLFFTITLYEWVEAGRDKMARATRINSAIALCALVFASQIVFSFYKEQYLDDITFNNTLITHLNETLVPALHELTTAHGPLSVPSLGGTYLGSSRYQLPDVSEFSLFLGIKNVTWIPPGKSSATSSPAFAEALKHDERLRSWYLAEGEIYETCSEEPVKTTARPVTTDQTVFIAKSTNTLQTSHLYFDITAIDAPEKIFLSVAFENDFTATSTSAIIRLDQYTKRTQGDVRRYVCSVNLYEIPVFALSKVVKNISLTITTEGAYTINEIRLQKNDETLRDGTQ